MAEEHEDPFRLRVLQALTDAIKGVTIDAGFKHDLGDYVDEGVTRERVFRGRDQFGFDDPRPMVSILEHPRALDALLAPDGDSQTIGPWEILIQGFVTDDPEHPTDPAHRLVADVIKALAIQAKRRAPDGSPDILGLGYQMPAVKDKGMKIGKPVCRPADGEISDVAFFFITLTLDLVEDVAEPFA